MITCESYEKRTKEEKNYNTYYHVTCRNTYIVMYELTR